jgi:hypothetical protein
MAARTLLFVLLVLVLAACGWTRVSFGPLTWQDFSPDGLHARCVDVGQGMFVFPSSSAARCGEDLQRRGYRFNWLRGDWTWRGPGSPPPLLTKTVWFAYVCSDVANPETCHAIEQAPRPHPTKEACEADGARVFPDAADRVVCEERLVLREGPE